MNVTKKQLPKNQLELTAELTTEELRPYLENAAKDISTAKKIALQNKKKQWIVPCFFALT